jgi:hypothetical protein
MLAVAGPASGQSVQELLRAGEEGIAQTCANADDLEACRTSQARALDLLRNSARGEPSPQPFEMARQLCAAQHPADFVAWLECETIQLTSLQALSSLPTERAEERWLRDDCLTEHGMDARARLECELEARRALAQWDTWKPEGVPTRVAAGIKEACAFQHRARLDRRSACIEEQLDAWAWWQERGPRDPVGSQLLELCAATWGHDYVELRTCEASLRERFTEDGSFDPRAELLIARARRACDSAFLPGGGLWGHCMIFRLINPAFRGRVNTPGQSTATQLLVGSFLPIGKAYRYLVAAEDALRWDGALAGSVGINFLPVAWGVAAHGRLDYRFASWNTRPAVEVPVRLRVRHHMAGGALGLRLYPTAFKRSIDGLPLGEGGWALLPYVELGANAMFVVTERALDPGEVRRSLRFHAAPVVQGGLMFLAPSRGKGRISIDLVVDGRVWVGGSDLMIIRNADALFELRPVHGGLGLSLGLSWTPDLDRMLRPFSKPPYEPR